MSDLISIDWDFFIYNGWHKSVKTPANGEMPGLLVYDWQMHERRAKEFQNVLWEIRAANLRGMGLDPIEATRIALPVDEFAYQMGYRWPMAEAPSWYADSHAWIGPVIQRMSEDYGPLTVFNFDAHHDLGYEPGQIDLNFSKGEFECDDWAYWGLRSGNVENFIQVYPDWLGRAEWEKVKRPHLDELQDRIQVLTWSEFLLEYTEAREDVAANFICRSSAWTPPWHDLEFQQLVEEFGYSDCLDCIGEATKQVEKNHDVCEPREWLWSNVEEHEEMRDRVLKLHEEKRNG